MRQRNGVLERKLRRVTSALEELESITETRTRELYDANISLAKLGDRLSSFLPDQVRRLMEEGEDSAANLVARRRYITVIFGDLSGFTSIAEVLDPEAVTEIMNEYFEAVSELVAKHGGLLDKFIGDGFMAFWGAPESDGKQKDAVRCARFGIEMRDRFKKEPAGHRSPDFTPAGDPQRLLLGGQLRHAEAPAVHRHGQSGQCHGPAGGGGGAGQRNHVADHTIDGFALLRIPAEGQAPRQGNQASGFDLRTSSQ
jgi:hypothetical protein